MSWKLAIKKSCIRNYLITRLLVGTIMGWVMAIYVLYLLENGLTLEQANKVNMFFMVSGALLDPLTGNLGDWIGQRRIYLAGLAVFPVGLIIYGLNSSFWGFATAETVLAAGKALMSEALESWLGSRTDEEEYRWIRKQGSTLEKAGSVPTALACSLVAPLLGLGSAWFLAAATSIFVWILNHHLLEQFQEPEKKLGPQIKGWFSSLLKKKGGTEEMGLLQAVLWLTGNRSLVFLILISAISSLLFQPLNMFWQPIFKEAGAKIELIGQFWMGIILFSILGNQLAGKGRLKDNRGIGIALLAAGLPIAIAVLFSKSLVLSLSLYLAHEIGRGILDILVRSYTNEYIDQEKNGARNTINSVREGVRTLGGSLGLLLFGRMTVFFPPLATWLVSAIALIVLSAYAWRRKD